MSRAPERKEAIFRGISVQSKPHNTGYSSAIQPHRHIGFQIELPVAGLARFEVSTVLRIIAEKAFAKHIVDLITWLGDAWADSCGDPRGLCAQIGHGRNRLVSYPGVSAFPAGMGCAHNAGFTVRQQHRCAICGQYAE